jgi:hypothetical protein
MERPCRDEYGRGGGRHGSQQRERDDQGRFTREEERGGARYSSRDDDFERDERGHFVSQDERGWSGRRGGRDDDYRDSNRSAGRDHGGWYGEPRRHAEAARRGWLQR